MTLNFWTQIAHELAADKSLYLITVIENFDSSPGRRGFKMAVGPQQFMCGSIGGGVMEHNLVEEAKRLLNSAAAPIFLKRQIHRGTPIDGSGMICSGEQTVVFHPLNRHNLGTIQAVIAALQGNKSGILQLSPSNLRFIVGATQKKPYTHHINSKTDWHYQELLPYQQQLYIIGAGHVGLATAKLFAALGYAVHIFDNRPGLNTFEQNTYAQHKQIINYNTICDYIPSNSDNCYIAIMTHNYKDDKLVLSKLIDKPASFLGVLGSKAKLKIMFEVMQKQGISSDALARVYAPIGVAINSQTPDEIAVSIAAQVIGVKNG